MYKLACPSCRQVTEHSFVRVGARVQCDKCQSIYVIDKKYIRRKVRLVPLSAETDLTFGEQKDFYQDVFVGDDEDVVRRDELVVLVPPDEVDKGENQVAGTGSEDVSSFGQMKEYFNERLPKKAFKGRPRFLLSGGVCILLIFGIWLALPNTPEQYVANVPGLPVSSFITPAELRQAEKTVGVQALAITEDFGMSDWKTDEVIEYVEPSFQHIEIQDDNIRFDDAQKTYFYSGEISAVEEELFLVEDLVVSLLDRQKNVAAQSLADPFLVIYEKNLPITKAVRRDLLGTDSAPPTWQHGKVSPIEGFVRLERCAARAFTSDGVFLLVKIENPTHLPLDHTLVVIHRLDSLNNAVVHQWHSVWNHELRGKDVVTFAIRVKDIHDIQNANFSVSGYGFSDSIDPRLASKLLPNYISGRPLTLEIGDHLNGDSDAERLPSLYQNSLDVKRLIKLED